MAQVFQINGANLTYIAKADWRDRSVAEVLSGKTVFHRWRQHYWETNVVSAAEFNTLYALEGQKVDITTIDYTDRDGAYKTYYGAELRRIQAQHLGPVLQQLMIEFWVRL